MKRGTALLLVSGVFLAGVAVGALGMWGVSLGHPIGMRRFDRGEWFAEHLTRRLHLTSEQAERIGDILRETREESRSLRETWRPGVQAILEKSTRRIDEVLTPVQREEFARLRRENGARTEFFLLGRGPMTRWPGSHRRGPRSAPASD